MKLNRKELRKIQYDFNSCSNRLLQANYEDPTRLMFKVEFGDWGYSVLDTETIKNQ